MERGARSGRAPLRLALTLAAIVWAGGWRILGGAITFGTLVAFIGYAEKFFRPLEELSQRYAVMQAAMASAERIFGLLDEEPTIISPASPRRITGRARGEIALPDPRSHTKQDMEAVLSSHSLAGLLKAIGTLKPTHPFRSAHYA